MSKHKSKTEIARRTARCSLRLTEEDLSWVQAQAVLRGCSWNAVFEQLIRSARQSPSDWREIEKQEKMPMS
jgi:predicted DNA binding CopG/RHH family protein